MESKSRNVLNAAKIGTLYCGAALAGSSDYGAAAPKTTGPVFQTLPAAAPFPRAVSDFKSDAPGTSR